MEVNMELLKNQVALVTGAGRGWGQSICLAYARQGAMVIAASRSQPELDKTAALVRAEGGQIEVLRLDVCQESEVRQAAATILEKYSRLDVLVNNAAQLPIKLFEEMTLAEFDQVLRVNLRGPILLCQIFLEPMKRQGGGSIINVSSNSGMRPYEKEIAYCTSKFALEGFSKTLALEVRKYNIAVNTITPGGQTAGVRIKPTNLTQEDYEKLSQSEKDKWADSIVMSEAFVFLALQRGEGVTGERILAYEVSDQIRREGWNIHYQRIAEPL
jgi:NAD(P)-dependent dehydrogenase (short-subunit alcohol dehydrogenase family)